MKKRKKDPSSCLFQPVLEMRWRGVGAKSWDRFKTQGRNKKEKIVAGRRAGAGGGAQQKNTAKFLYNYLRYSAAHPSAMLSAADPRAWAGVSR